MALVFDDVVHINILGTVVGTRGDNTIGIEMYQSVVFIVPFTTCNL